MRLAEKIVLGIVLTGMLFRLMHWPFAGLLLILSLSTLATFYFPLAVLWFGRPSMRDQVIWFSIVAGFGLSIMLVGLLFKLQHWPLANAYVVMGTVFCAALALLSVTLGRKKPEHAAYFRGVLWRASILGGIGALMLVGRSLKSEAQEAPADAEHVRTTEVQHWPHDHTITLRIG